MHDVGSVGEMKAKEFLLRKGYRWVASNYSTKWGEIDLIMEDGATLVFVEVKIRRGNRYGRPEEAITRFKMRHLERAAMVYLFQTKNTERQVRFDVIAIDPSGTRHYPHAFLSGGSYYV